MDSFQVYRDMKVRTNGEIYIGVVGPVRTGKSTFIKRFMDLLVLPNMTDEHARERTKDELPQSASGTTIMTTEPKFVPKEAASVKLSDDVEVKIRLIDCVGYMVEGASGHIENDTERQVKTPWFEYEIPFTKAAAIGTQKVIRDHATIGFVVTTDGSVTDLPRESYIPAEEKTVKELQSIGKPFLILLNCLKPYGEEAKALKEELQQKYNAPVFPVNCEQLKAEDINEIMRQILYQFPVTEVEFYLPKWVEMLSRDHRIKQDLLEHIRRFMENMDDIRSAVSCEEKADSPYINEISVEKVEMDTGKVRVRIGFEQKYYYEVLSELTGTQIKGEYELISTMKELSAMKEEFSQIKDAFADVKIKGYGVVSPKKEEIRLDDPVIIKQGSKYGVKIRSEAPSIHMIRANIETEIAPIVGNEKQAEDLVEYIRQESETPEGVWGTNIFGKSVEELVMDGIRSKIAMINDESQSKLQDSMQKIVNDSNGGMVCIII
ncbi:MAG TPA: stage IV sporulation protein A [Candidatus Mediterraneibacter caccogallinarum]|nr:stage IV sporulation protein A [Candidatus Mediterraneibacter caccogallinarum]